MLTNLANAGSFCIRNAEEEEEDDDDDDDDDDGIDMSTAATGVA